MGCPVFIPSQNLLAPLSISLVRFCCSFLTTREDTGANQLLGVSLATVGIWPRKIGIRQVWAFNLLMGSCLVAHICG